MKKLQHLLKIKGKRIMTRVRLNWKEDEKHWLICKRRSKKNAKEKNARKQTREKK